MPYIYAITEESVDGCGGGTTEFVTFRQPLQPNQRKKLLDYLAWAKADARAKSGTEDCETVDMVNEALRRFEARTGIDGHVTGSPVFDTLSF